MEKGLSQHFKKETSLFLLATLTAKPTIDRNHRRTSAHYSASTTRTRTNVSERHNNPLAPSGNDRLILASIRFSNTAVQENAVQQPIQQRRRTSAKIQNTQRTEQSCFKHKKDKGEHQRTTQVESPLRQSEFFLRTLSELKLGYKGLEILLFFILVQQPYSNGGRVLEPIFRRCYSVGIVFPNNEQGLFVDLNRLRQENRELAVSFGIGKPFHLST